jgi:hypothetical protein
MAITASTPFEEYWIAYDRQTNNPIIHHGALGPFIPVYNNPVAAREWAESTQYRDSYYVRQNALRRVGEKL